MSVQDVSQVFSLNPFPQQILECIVIHSSLSTISKISRTCHELNKRMNEASFWNFIGTTIHCPINPRGGTSKEQVRHFVKITAVRPDELFPTDLTRNCSLLAMKCSFAYCYFDKLGPSAQSTHAIEWYQEESELGNLDAQATLAFLYGKGIGVEQDISKMISLYQEAADQGGAQAQFELGKCYRFGRGVSKDKAQAIKWYGKAIMQGHSKAEFEMWNYYTVGKDPDMDAEVFSWFRMGAEFKKSLPT